MGKQPTRVVRVAALGWRRLADISTAAWLWSFIPSGVASVIAGWLAYAEGLPRSVVLLIVVAMFALVMVIAASWRAWRNSGRIPQTQPTTQQPHWTADKYSEEWKYHAHGKPVERDTPLGEAFAFIVTREWGRSFSQSLAELFQESARNPFDELRQAAHEGRVTVWGRLHPDTLFRKIPANHWDEHQVDGKALLMNEYARTWGSDATSYGHLMVSRTEIEKEWPHE